MYGKREEPIPEETLNSTVYELIWEYHMVYELFKTF